ncbi:diguanylate cyclase [Pantoea graminicola]|uniref:DinB family protein n=1 Tax=Pantoea sp. ARC607 TaxID=2027922 RepID=UPI000DAA7EE5|nr:DinB family protein [Pantoea sp. ARC607]PZL94817.1 diguanylate cyclase [Pantoea sp. ARC607]
MDKDRIVTLLMYKRWIDAETLKSIKEIGDTAYAGKRHQMLRLMNHIYVVDRIFEANMSGEPHGYTALNTPDTPTAEALEASMAACTERYIQRVTAMTPDDAARIINFTFIDGGNGEMRVSEMLDHVLFHGTYHRGAVGWLIAECGGVPPKDVLTVFLRDHHR